MSGIDLAKQLQQALDHQAAGRLAEAEALYRQIIIAQPNHTDALHLLGVLAAQVGRFDVAHDLIRRAIAINPSVAQYHYNLGNVLRDRKMSDEAIVAYHQALRLNPNYAEVHNNLGNVLRDKGRVDDAIIAFREAVRLNPKYLDVHLNLGVALRDKEQLDEAIAAYRQVLRLDPDHVKALYNLGIALNDKGLKNDAVTAFRHAIRQKPDYAEAHNNLGTVLGALERHDEAVAALRQAVRLKPEYAEARSNLGNALAACGMLDEALAEYREAVRLKPDLAKGHSSLGNALSETGQIEEAMLAYRCAVQLDPDFIDGHSNLLFAMHSDPASTSKSILTEHRAWAERHADSFGRNVAPHTNDRSLSRRLRIGYVSPDFFNHPVGRFMLPLLRNHDHEQFEIFCYASVSTSDDNTVRFQKHADVWRDIRALSDIEAAKLIRKDQIDILVDLTMHSNGNRLRIFARKPSPIQATYLAYPGTTGLESIDYRITDPYLDPPELGDDHYSEKSVYIKSYWCYEPPIENLQVAPLPATAAGCITFGCLNKFGKISPPALQTWCAILAAVPNSRLMIHAKDGKHRDRFREMVAKSGIDPSRLEMVAALTLPDYMAQYSRIDIGLDPFPYVGGTTTCDALWMGVPIITLRGKIAISRGGVSILSNIGLNELIADSPEQYICVAAELAGDLPRLSNLRLTLRDKMNSSPLTDARQNTKDIESAYRQMWENWCASRL